MAISIVLAALAVLGASCGGNPAPKTPADVSGIDFGQFCRFCPQPTPCPPPVVCPDCPPPVVCPPEKPCPPEDPCQGVTCFKPNEVCVPVDGEGVCKPVVAPTCDGHRCPAGEHCVLVGDVPTCVPDAVPPGPTDCKKFKPTTTGWSLLACTLNGKLVCGGGQGKKCDCSGAGCTFTLPVGAACDGDSTPRHLGEPPNWKTCTCLDHGDELPCNEWPVCVDGKVERSEYPPKPAYGWECAGKTKWSADPAVSLDEEGDGYGARLKFPKAGTLPITVCRADGTHCTQKKARIK